MTPHATGELKRLAADLTFGDGFYAQSTDEESAADLVNGFATFRGLRASLAAYKAPPTVPESLRKSWLFFYHSLVFLDALRRRYKTEGLNAYRETFFKILDDWLTVYRRPPRRLPTAKEPGDFAWYDMSAAWRCQVLIAGLEIAEDPAGLLEDIRRHADVLARDDFYAGEGNHALHQDNALLSAGVILGERPFVDKAAQRILALKEKSIDAEGVILEGSIAYHFFNAFWWIETDKRFAVCARHGVELPSLDLPEMREFMGWGVAPDGKLIMIGDTCLSNSPTRNVLSHKFPTDYLDYLNAHGPLRGAFTRGQESEIVAGLRVFQDGFAFSRIVEEAAYARPVSCASIRFGRGLTERVHGHDDAGSVTYYAGLHRVLEDGGMYGYYGGAAREFVKSNLAHNVVGRNGAKYYRSAVAEIMGQAEDRDAAHLVRVDCPNVEGVKWRRVFAHARALSGFCVQDLVETVVDGGEVFQNWNLGDAFRIVSVDVNRVVFSSGAVHGAMLWAEAPKRILVYAGEEAPLVGWRSTFEGELHEVATISARLGCRKAGDVVKTTTVFAMAPTLKEAKALRITNADYASETTRVTLARGGADVNLFWRVAPGNYEVKCA